MRALYIFICLVFAIGGYSLGYFLQKTGHICKPCKNPDSTTLSEIIRATTKQELLTFDPNLPTHRDILTHVRQCADEAIIYFNKPDSPSRQKRRINEVSRLFEDFLLKQINTHRDFQCSIPLDQNQQARRNGYPDLFIKHNPSGTKCYLDPKLLESSSKNSSFRSFYYSPQSKTQKIHHDALHLLIGFEHNGKDGEWIFKKFHIVDLSDLPLKLKMEYSSSNKLIYQQSIDLETL